MIESTKPPLILRLCFRFLNLFCFMGHWELELQCRECRRIVNLDRTDAHDRLFHPERVSTKG